ncbi:translocation protein TolB [Neobacillus niacini]|uniref:translocation protein TolB n=1 Tax=Neobacillus niacini TaxID=86668 RepID=UPI002FFEDD1C
MKKILLIIFLTFTFIPSIVSAAPNDNLKAAFVRNDHLWLKINEKEMKITDSGYIRYPKWSFDGSWIAYLKSAKEGDVFDLWTYNVKNNKHFKVQENVSDNFQWSPNEKNKIGFQVAKNIFILQTGQLGQFIPVAKNIENFSWLPTGNGLLISTKKSPKLNSDIILSKVILRKNEKPKINHFYTIKVNKDEILISTSPFYWSNDKKWISFLLVPTASLSADGNILSVLSANGKAFHRIDEMLNEEAWFQWAPFKSLLGYISGTGREATISKKLKTLNAMTLENSMYTPTGFVDRDLTWQNNQTLYVSRSKESSEGSLDTRPLPILYKISLSDNRQTQVTAPPKNFGDFKPQVVKNNLFWIRNDRKNAHVLVSPTYQMEEKIWIKNINIGSSYYEKWSWDEVFSLYTGR